MVSTSGLPAAAGHVVFARPFAPRAFAMPRHYCNNNTIFLRIDREDQSQAANTYVAHAKANITTTVLDLSGHNPARSGSQGMPLATQYHNSVFIYLSDKDPITGHACRRSIDETLFSFHCHSVASRLPSSAPSFARFVRPRPDPEAEQIPQLQQRSTQVPPFSRSDHKMRECASDRNSSASSPRSSPVRHSCRQQGRWQARQGHRHID